MGWLDLWKAGLIKNASHHRPGNGLFQKGSFIMFCSCECVCTCTETLLMGRLIPPQSKSDRPITHTQRYLTSLSTPPTPHSVRLTDTSRHHLPVCLCMCVCVFCFACMMWTRCVCTHVCCAIEFEKVIYLNWVWH